MPQNKGLLCVCWFILNRNTSTWCGNIECFIISLIAAKCTNWCICLRLLLIVVLLSAYTVM